MTAKSIVITESDFDRLSALLESPRYRASHAMFLAGLRDELEHGDVVAPAEVPETVVTMNSQVRVQDLGTGEIEEFTLCYPPEAKIAEGRLSVLAPLGTALLGSRVGAVIEFDAPAGRRRLNVVEIVFQPESEGAFHL